MRKCLYCYKELSDDEKDFHRHCARKMFGSSEAPVLPYMSTEVEKLAEQVIRSNVAVTGVQAKLSMDVEKAAPHESQRFTIVGLWGRYILKPQTERYAHLPEIEDLTMHLAEISKIETVPHSLIKFADGQLAYITRRIDRTKNGGKLPMEDMCQLTERMTENKYRASYEQIAKAIGKYATAPKLDIINFWQEVIFCFIVGNADMHLKNFSLYTPITETVRLTPAYDLLSTAIVIPEDEEDLALTLNAKKKKINRKDFIAAMQTSKIATNQADKLIDKLIESTTKWSDAIEMSFLTDELKQNLKDVIAERVERLVR